MKNTHRGCSFKDDFYRNIIFYYQKERKTTQRFGWDNFWIYYTINE